MRMMNCGETFSGPFLDITVSPLFLSAQLEVELVHELGPGSSIIIA